MGAATAPGGPMVVSWRPAPRCQQAMTAFGRHCLLAIAVLHTACSISGTTPTASAQVFQPPGVTAEHLKVYVAPVHPKYNYELHDNIMRFEPTRHFDYPYLHLQAPLGVPLVKSDLLWHTNQFGAAFWIHQQLLSSPLRVWRVEDADWVYVPVFVQHCKDYDPDRNSKDLLTEFFADPAQHLPHLGSKPHVVFSGKVEHWSTECGLPNANFTLVSIEPDQLHHQAHPWAAFNTSFSVTMPYPTSTHPSTNTIDYPRPAKTITATASFARRPPPIRLALADNCKARPAACTSTATLKANHVATASREYWNSLLATAELHFPAWFCLQPAGDTYTRRALFECLGYGAIPVIFDNFWLLTMPFADLLPIRDFIVSLAEDVPRIVDLTTGMAGSVNAIDILGNFTQERKKALHAAVLKHRHLYQYRLNPDHMLVNVSGLQAVGEGDDAFTMTLKALARNLCRRSLLPAARCGVLTELA